MYARKRVQYEGRCREVRVCLSVTEASTSISFILEVNNLTSFLGLVCAILVTAVCAISLFKFGDNNCGNFCTICFVYGSKVSHERRAVSNLLLVSEHFVLWGNTSTVAQEELAPFPPVQ